MTAVRIAFQLLFGLGVIGFLIWLLLQGILPEFYFLVGNSDLKTYALWLLGGVIPFVLVISIFWYLRALKEYPIMGRLK